jgi:hypothetical protein
MVWGSQLRSYGDATVMSLLSQIHSLLVWMHDAEDAGLRADQTRA